MYAKDPEEERVNNNDDPGTSDRFSLLRIRLHIRRDVIITKRSYVSVEQAAVAPSSTILPKSEICIRKQKSIK